MKTTMGKVRVRFAPSPTGYLHVGHLRLVLTDYLFARKHGGTFILRIEDTDRKRYVEGAVEKLVNLLSSFGFDPDEGVVLEGGELTEKGEFGPYTQSERLPIYRKYVDGLLADGKAYRCFCSTERLEEVRAEQARNKQAPKYDRHCTRLSEEEVRANMEAGIPHVIRMVVPDDREIFFADIVRGEIRFHTRDVDDQVLMKSDGFPTYHLAVVVDDHLMGITHIIRGEEWLSSTPKHVLLYEAFGWEIPQFAHLPLLLNPDRSKLSKRQGDVAAEDYLKKGYLPEALINFVALLGWNPGEGSTQELFSLDELVSAFDLAHVNKAGAVFDLKKLDWMNAEYIKRLTHDELLAKLRSGGFLDKPLIAGADEDRRVDEYLKRVIVVMRERLVRLGDFGETEAFLFAEPVLEPAMLPWKDNTAGEAKAMLSCAVEIIEGIAADGWSRESLGSTLLDAAGEKRGDFLWPIRVALSGEKKSPPPQDIAWVIGKDATLARIRRAIDCLA